jgi:hypothetical protein
MLNEPRHAERVTDAPNRSLRWAAPGQGSGGLDIGTPGAMLHTTPLIPKSQTGGEESVVTAPAAAELIITFGGFVFYKT